MADKEMDYQASHGSNTNGNVNGNLNQDHDNNYHLGPDETSDTALQRIRTAGSISISPELFEKLYLSPQQKVKGDLRKTFGNPTPLSVLSWALVLLFHPSSSHGKTGLYWVSYFL